MRISDWSSDVCSSDLRGDASHMPLMLIETESTPNPATLKFLPGRPVMETGTRDFPSPADAAASPLATALFTLGDVTGVFFGRAFISVTIAPGAAWADAKPDVLGIVMDHFLADMPLFHPARAAGFAVPAEDEGFADDPADADIRLEDDTSELQSLMRNSNAVLDLKQKYCSKNHAIEQNTKS